MLLTLEMLTELYYGYTPLDDTEWFNHDLRWSLRMRTTTKT